MISISKNQISASTIILLLALAYPWVHPFALPVATAVFPWLATLLCTVLAWWIVERHAVASAGDPPSLHKGSRWLWLWLGLFAALVLLRTPQFNGQTLLTVAAVGVMAMAIGIGSKAVGAPAVKQIVIAALLLAALANSIVAMFQFFGWEHYFAPLMNGLTGEDIYGNLRQRNLLATLTNVGLAALIWGKWGKAFDAGQGAQVSGRSIETIASWVALILLVSANAVSQSRTGTLEVVLISVLAIVWRGGLSRKGLVLGLSAAPVYALMCVVMPFIGFWVTGKMGPGLWERFDPAGATLCYSRVNLYQNVLELIGAKPWLGWGWRELIYAHYVGDTSRRLCDILDHAHNLPLHLAVELGVPAALLLVLTPLGFILKAKPWKETHPIRQMAWAVVAVIGLHSMLEYPLWYGPFLLAFGLCLGLLWPGEKIAMGSDSSKKWYMFNRTIVLVVVALGVVWAFNGYYRLILMYRFGTASWPTEMRNGNWEFNSHLPYADHIEFFNMMTTPLTPENAKAKYEMGERLLHFSPEARIVAEHINAAYLAGVDQQTLDTLLARFKRAFPKQYESFVTGKPAQ